MVRCQHHLHGKHVPSPSHRGLTPTLGPVMALEAQGEGIRQEVPEGEWKGVGEKRG